MARKRRLPEGLTEDALDALTAEVRTPAELEAVFRDLKKALVERMLRAELTEHLGYPEGSERPDGAINARNGTTPKTVLTDEGPCRWRFPGTGPVPLHPSWCRRESGGCRASIRKCSRSMPAVSRCASSRPTWKSATRCRSPPT